MEEDAVPTPDDQVVSVATLRQVAASPVPVTSRMVHWITTAELEEVPDVSALITEALDGVTRLSEAVSAEALQSVPREALERACRRGGLSGYLFGRVLLGTQERRLPWPPSQSVERPFDSVGDMELFFDLPPQWAEITIEAIRGAVKGSGFTDPEPDEPLGSAAALAFDQAMAIALIEHDLCLGRLPG
jgi:hypothetical protein